MEIYLRSISLILIIYFLLYIANIHELISDFTLKSKQLEYLISALPTRAPLSESDGTSPSTEERLDDEDGDTPLSELVKEYNAVNEEYKSCIEEAGNVIFLSFSLLSLFSFYVLIRLLSYIRKSK